MFQYNQKINKHNHRLQSNFFKLFDISYYIFQLAGPSSGIANQKTLC